MRTTLVAAASIPRNSTPDFRPRFAVRGHMSMIRSRDVLVGGVERV
jgi:hypothetical protein